MLHTASLAPPVATATTVHAGPDRHLHKPQLIAHRRARSLALGPCMWLQFEDELTVHHQIQEVLHAEGAAAQGEALQREVDTYTHLLPDGSNWKATLLIGLPDAAKRARELPELNEAAHRLYVQLPRHPRVYAQANEDLPDRHLGRPSAVHFLRFQFPPPLRIALLAGADASVGCEHDAYAFRRVIPMVLLEQLRCDLAH